MLSTLIYLQACAWAEWDLMPVRYHRRVHRLAAAGAGAASPASAVVAGLGVLLGLARLVTG